MDAQELENAVRSEALIEHGHELFRGRLPNSLFECLHEFRLKLNASRCQIANRFPIDQFVKRGFIPRVDRFLQGFGKLLAFGFGRLRSDVLFASDLFRRL